MAETEPKSELRFSMRTLLVVVTVACLVFALPGGYVLIIFGTAWALIGAAILGVLLKFRGPIYRLLAGKRR